MSFQPKDINSGLTPADYIQNTVMIATKIEQSGNGSSSMDNVRAVSENFTVTNKASFDTIVLGNTDINDFIDEINDGAGLDDVNNTVAEYDEMKKKRDNLEEKMEEMEKEDTDVNLQTESTVYTTLLITALGTSLLYFFFRKI
jgi:chromosome segregation ATPase